MGLGNMPDGNIVLSATSVPGDLTIQDLDMDIETRPHSNGSSNKEEFRWVLRMTVFMDLKEVTLADDVYANSASTLRIDGTLNGSTRTSVYLQSGDESWPAEFYLIKESLNSVEAQGSKMMRHTQSWMATTEWADAPWEA